MKRSIYFMSITLIFFSCKKKISPSQVEQADEIVYTDINPDFILSSADSVYYIPFGPGCPVAAPVDSTIDFELDLNDDNIVDFKMNMHHWYNFLSASNPCVNYNYSMSIAGIGNNKISITSNYNEVVHFDFDQEISNSLVWNGSASIMRIDHSVPFSHNFSGPTYFGLKLEIGTKTHYGWVLVDKMNYTLHIKEMGFNETSANSIKAGQIL